MLPGASLYTTPPSVAPRWSLVTAGTALAVDLDTVKDFLNRPREDTYFDDQITSFIRIATLSIENYLRMTLVESTWLGTMPYLYDQLRITMRPFVSVDTIEIVQPDDGVIAEVSSSIWHALPIHQYCGMVFLGEGEAWPDIARRHDAVRITATAGFPEGELPDDIEHALLMTIAAIDSKRGDQRETGGSDVTVYAMKQAKGNSLIPVEARALIDQYKLQMISVG